MWRTVLSIGIVYGCGSPGFDGLRPAALDRPLQAFYAEVNQAAREGHRTIANLGDTRLARYLKNYVARTEARLRSSD